MSRLPATPGGRRRGLRGQALQAQGLGSQRGGGGRDGRRRRRRQRWGVSGGQRGRRGRGSRVRGGALVAAAPPEGPGAAPHLAQAADGVEDDGGAVDGQLGQIHTRRRLALRFGSDPVLQVRGKRPGLKVKKTKEKKNADLEHKRKFGGGHDCPSRA